MSSPSVDPSSYVFLFSLAHLTKHAEKSESQFKVMLFANEFGDFPLQHVLMEHFKDIVLPTAVCNEVYSYLYVSQNNKDIEIVTEQSWLFRNTNSYFLMPMFADYLRSVHSNYAQNALNIMPTLLRVFQMTLVFVYVFSYLIITDDQRTERALIYGINGIVLAATMLINIGCILYSIVKVDTLKRKVKTLSNEQSTDGDTKRCYYSVVQDMKHLLDDYVYQWLPFSSWKSPCIAAYPFLLCGYYVVFLTFGVLLYFVPDHLSMFVIAVCIIAGHLIYTASGLLQKTYRRKPFCALCCAMLILLTAFLVYVSVFNNIYTGNASIDALKIHYDFPTPAPTLAPTTAPTWSPSSAPSADPTKAPTTAPTWSPSDAPSASPTNAPSVSPTITNGYTMICSELFFVSDRTASEYGISLQSVSNPDYPANNISDVIPGSSYYQHDRIVCQTVRPDCYTYTIFNLDQDLRWVNSKCGKNVDGQVLYSDVKDVLMANWIKYTYTICIDDTNCSAVMYGARGYIGSTTSRPIASSSDMDNEEPAPATFSISISTLVILCCCCCCCALVYAWAKE